MKALTAQESQSIHVVTVLRVLRLSIEQDQHILLDVHLKLTYRRGQSGVFSYQIRVKELKLLKSLVDWYDLHPSH